MSKKTKICSDCNGSGEYYGNLADEDCPTCQGLGVIGVKRKPVETGKQKEIRKKMEFDDFSKYEFRGHKE